MARKNKSKAGKSKEQKVPAVVKRLEKQGKVTTRVRQVIPALSGLAGSFLGGPAGGAVGLAAGKLISAITGFGDYKIQSNSISMGNSVPSFRTGGDGVPVTHREFIMDVVGSTGFTLSSFPINPGMSNTFPWLSLMGNHFEEYDMSGLVYEYRPSSGSAVSSASSALGVVVLATDYDAANPPFGNKQQMESYEFSTSTVPFNGCLHPVECMRGRNVLDNLYLRSGSPPSGTDIRMYDMGNFQIATQGMQSSYVVGELWVSYDVIFRKPRIPGSMSAPLGAFAHVVSDPISSAGGPSTFFGTGGAVLTAESTMDSTDISSSGTGAIVIKKPGIYTLATCYDGSTSSSVFTLTTGSNISNAPSNLNRGSPASNYSLQATLFGMDTRYLTVAAAGTGAGNTVSFVQNPVSGLTGDNDVLITRISNSTSASLTTTTSSTTFSSRVKDNYECKTPFVARDVSCEVIVIP